MSNETQTALPPDTALAYSKLSPEGATVAHAQLKAAGYDVSKLSVGVIGQPAIHVSVAAPEAPKPNAERVAQWRSMQKGWTGDPAIVVREAAKAGIDLTTSPEAEAAVSEASLAANRAAATQAAVSPPAAANDYGDITWPNAKDISPTELGAQDTLWKTSLFSAGVPEQYVQTLIDAAFASAKTYQSRLGEYATDQDREAENVALQIRVREEVHRIRSLPDQDVAQYAQIALDALPKAFRAALDENRALSSAEAFAALSLIGKAISQRKTK